MSALRRSKYVPRFSALWPRKLSVKLVFLLLVSTILVFSLLGYLNIRLHRHHLEQATLLSAERISDVIKRSTTEYMLRNDRDGLHRLMQTYAREPGMLKLRVFDSEGRIGYTTDPSETSHVVDKSAEACYACHAQSQPLSRLNRPDRFRIYRNAAGMRVLGIITPIDNQPSCSNASCHAHPAEQRILGVLDANLSLAKTDEQLAESTKQMAAYTACALFLVGCVSWFFVWRLVAIPLRALERGTERLAHGDLTCQIPVSSSGEIGDLARSFNSMSSELLSAHEENLAWTRTLEERVEQKTTELKRAHEHALHNEKMASIGKLAAVVAHEVNNPLSGILTYAKLLRKWVGAGPVENQKRQEALQCLELIATESQRCGDLLKNLLSLSRSAPMHVQTTDLRQVIDRCLLLVRHKLELTGVELDLNLPKGLPPVPCDPAQIEQVLLALIMNAIDAMPHGGRLGLAIRTNRDENEVAIEVRDDGAGIAPDVLPQIFEPFVTTKENGGGVGLGLAISHGIVERHGGRIEVESELGKGTIFTVILPIQGCEPELAIAGDAHAAKVR
jgi:two-component system, NtrC family, sensor kinase